MEVCHFSKIDQQNIKVKFSDDRKHRFYLELPFANKIEGNALCIIGQNPSSANARIADKTINYIERYVYEKLPQYSKIIILNLYSRVDTKKTETSDLIREESYLHLNEIISNNTDFLIIYGKLDDKGEYKFAERAKELKSKLIDKSVFKFDIGCNFAPHPGNNNIYYGNYCYGITEYNFEDVL